MRKQDYLWTSKVIGLMNAHVYLWVVGKLGSWLILLVQTYGQKQSTHSHTDPHFVNGWLKTNTREEGREERRKEGRMDGNWVLVNHYISFQKKN